MFDGRVKKIIDFLKEKFTEETESTRTMLKIYSDYVKGEAKDEDIEKANKQLNEILKDLSFGLMAVIPFAPITIPMIAKFAKKHNIDLLPEWFKDSLK
jgi:methyl coenzyme M reductase alpha subunit